MKTAFYFIGLLLFAVSCRQKDYKPFTHDPLLYSKTVHELNSVVMGNNFTPVVASRNYAYAAIAGYEVIAAGYPQQYRSLAGQLNGLDTVAHSTDTAGVDYEFAALLAYCKVGEAVTFPEGSMQDYVSKLQQQAREAGMSDHIIQQCDSYADTVARSILKWSKKDNYLQTRSAVKYTVTDTPGRWVPTPPMYAPAVEMHWAEIRPMVMDSAGQFKSPPPLRFDVKDKNSEYTGR